MHWSHVGRRGRMGWWGWRKLVLRGTDRSQGAYLLERISSGSPWVGMSGGWFSYASCRVRGGLPVAMEITGAPDFQWTLCWGSFVARHILVFNCFISHPKNPSPPFVRLWPCLCVDVPIAASR